MLRVFTLQMQGLRDGAALRADCGAECAARRIDPLEAALDPVEPLALVVQAQAHVGDLRLQVRRMAHVAEFALDVAERGADGMQSSMARSSIMPRFGQDAPSAALRRGSHMAPERCARRAVRSQPIPSPHRADTRVASLRPVIGKRGRGARNHWNAQHGAIIAQARPGGLQGSAAQSPCGGAVRRAPLASPGSVVERPPAPHRAPIEALIFAKSASKRSSVASSRRSSPSASGCSRTKRAGR